MVLLVPSALLLGEGISEGLQDGALSFRTSVQVPGARAPFHYLMAMYQEMSLGWFIKRKIGVLIIVTVT